MIYKNSQRGTLLVLVLVLSSIFFILLTGLMHYVITQHQVQIYNAERERAREIAEAGLNYYKWYLAHYTDDVTHGTGEPGPYVIAYEDPEYGHIGYFEIEVSGSSYCDQVGYIDIVSTGYTNDEPNIRRTIQARYSRPTVAEYSFIINSNVWSGSDRVIVGPFHSNGGIRMDGDHNSTVTSGQEEWLCTASFGCSPNQTVDGIFGDGTNPALWHFPSTPINFTGLNTDLAEMRNHSINNGGIYIGSSGAGAHGYLVSFNNNNTITVHRVLSTESYTAYSVEEGTHTEDNVITGTELFGIFDIPEECPLIFVEDKIWLQGEVSLKASIAAANPSDDGSNPSIILNNNITYTNDDAGLLAIAEGNVLVGLQVPDHMTVNGIYIAQKGRFSRNHYYNSGLPEWLRPYVQRERMDMLGTITSNGRVGTKWTSGGAFVSGFDDRFNEYDRNLVNNPPPLTPRTSDDYRFMEWRDID